MSKSRKLAYIRGKRGTQFRMQVNRNLREYMIKGFVMDD